MKNNEKEAVSFKRRGNLFLFIQVCRYFFSGT